MSARQVRLFSPVINLVAGRPGSSLPDSVDGWRDQVGTETILILPLPAHPPPSLDSVAD